MVNKKGWVRIFEATIIIGLIFGVLIFVSQKNKILQPTSSIEERLAPLLDEIAKNSNIRNEIFDKKTRLTKDNSNQITQYITAHIPASFDYTFKVCDNSNPSLCNLVSLTKIPKGNDLYVAERILSTTLKSNNFNPLKIRLYVWRKT